MGANVDLELIRKLAEVLKEFDLGEVEVEVKGLRVRLSQHAPPPPAPTPVPMVQAPAQAPAPPKEEEAPPKVQPAKGPSEEEVPPGLHAIRSPIVGTFYRAPAPGAEPFTDVGKRVRKGQTLCIVEAMKVMNEIESDVDGVVEKILVENGQPVEYGQILFLIKPD